MEVTEQHAKWLDNGTERINEDVECAFARILNKEEIDKIVDSAVPDPYVFAEQVFSRTAQYRKDPQRLGEVIAALVTSYLELDAVYTEDHRQYDPVEHDDMPWEE